MLKDKMFNILHIPCRCERLHVFGICLWSSVVESTVLFLPGRPLISDFFLQLEGCAKQYKKGQFIHVA